MYREALSFYPYIERSDNSEFNEKTVSIFPGHLTQYQLDQFLFEASARVTNVAYRHATTEDLVVAGIGGEEEGAGAEEEEGAVSEDLPDPERSADPAVVQVIVQRKKRKNGENSTRPASKRTRKAPARLLD